MNKLNPIDQIFYLLDASGTASVLMCGAMIVDPSSSPYPLDGQMLVEHVAARMEKIPLMRKKVMRDMLKLGSIKLVEDPDFDVRNHVSLASLKAPGGYKEFTEHLGDFSAQSLDLSRPLWHYEIIEGLEGGRIALLVHIHHCILDGVGATEALTSVWNVTPVAAERPNLNGKHVGRTPGSIALLFDAFLENAAKICIDAPALLLKGGTGLAGAAMNGIASKLDFETEIEPGGHATIPKVHKTSLNRSKLSAERVVSYAEFPLRDIKALGKHYQCSVNDLMILFSSYALEHYFKTIGEQIQFDLVAGMPVSIRESGDQSHGNKLRIARLSLHNRIRGIEARLRAIAHDTAAIKRPKKATLNLASAVDGEGLIGLFSPIVMEGLFLGMSKLNLMDQMTYFNVVITNIPGYPIPIYLAGAKQVATIPMPPIADTMGLTIGISSSDSHVSLGFNGCSTTIKNKELLVEGARHCFETLQKAAKRESAGEPAAPAVTPVRRKSASRRISSAA